MINLRLIMETEMFRGVVPFVAVARHKSFRRAAVQLGVSAAAVSKAVQALEARLGLPLLVRNARAVELTREGERYFASCEEAVAAVEGAAAVVEDARIEPTGQLVLSVPFVATPLLAPALALLQRRYSRLTFRVHVTDRLSKLAEESIDVAIRVGPMQPSSLSARRLKRTRLVTVAAPSYIARRGEPRTVAALREHDCMTLVGPRGSPWPFQLASGPLPIDGVVVLDHAPTLVDAVLAGLGVTQLFDYMAYPLIRDGKLALVLPDEIASGPDVVAVCAPGRRAAARVRAAFEAFADSFGPP